MIDWENLTWTCHVCGEERPDRFISVFTTQVLFGEIPIKQNVRHCNDRTECIEGAKNIQWVKGSA